MPNNINIDNIEYDLSNLSQRAKSIVDKYIYTSNRIKYLHDMLSHLEKARESYSKAVKTEVLSNKAGLFANMD
tara:strand:- start:321 stop:539 length:219 start_codon:yes stop_codon:yes gene_type:complete